MMLASATQAPLKFKYLGVELHGARNCKATVDHRLSRMKAAHGAIQRRLRETQAVREPHPFETITGASGSWLRDLEHAPPR
jgi:hypothetical protein